MSGHGTDADAGATICRDGKRRIIAGVAPAASRGGGPSRLPDLAPAF